MLECVGVLQHVLWSASMCIIITRGVHTPADLTCLVQGSNAHMRQEAFSKLQFCAKSACK